MKTRAQIIQELEILDRGWENELPQYMKKGTLPEADSPGMTIVIVMFSVFCIGFIGAGISNIARGEFLDGLFMAFWGIGLILVGIFNYNEFTTRKQNYEKASDAYSHKRNRLLKQLENL